MEVIYLARVKFEPLHAGVVLDILKIPTSTVKGIEDRLLEILLVKSTANDKDKMVCPGIQLKWLKNELVFIIEEPAKFATPPLNPISQLLNCDFSLFS